MKPFFAKILGGKENEVFATRQYIHPYFSTDFHFHRECQLNFLIESNGRRIIGDNVENFVSDEVTFLGSDIPHIWHNDKRYFDQEILSKPAQSVSLFFDPDKLVSLLSHLMSTKKLEATLLNARQGMIFHGTTKELLKKLLLRMSTAENIEKAICLLEILNALSSTEEYRLLASNGYKNTYQQNDNSRIDKVFKYVFDNYTEEIELEQVSALVNMNKQAFCRYFKSRTQRTFTTFVNEVRVAEACKLLADDANAINNIAYEVGFNSISNFNHFFKEIKGITPKTYKERIKA